MSSIRDLVLEISNDKQAIRDLTSELKDKEHVLIEMLVEQKMTSCLSINYATLNRYLR